VGRPVEFVALEHSWWSLLPNKPTKLMAAFGARGLLAKRWADRSHRAE